MWAELLSTALIGTERQAFKVSTSTESEKLNSLLSKLNNSDQEQNLLSAASLLTFYKEAGKIPSKREVELPSKCALEDLPCCSLGINQYIPSLLSASLQRGLSEVLEELIKLGKRISPENLPSLLDLGANQPTLQESICKVIGKRGFWLAAQNSRWEYANLEDITGKTVEEVWHTANQATRFNLLRKLRRENPNKAQDLLSKTWNKEDFSARSVFINVLEINLTVKDEPFLELALNDSRKEIRTTAQWLLYKMQYSKLNTSIFEQLKTVFKLGKTKNFIEINIPKQVDGVLLEYLNEHKVKIFSFTPDFFVRKTISIIDPDFWCKEWNISIYDFLSLVAKSKHKLEFYGALTQAIANYSKIEWVEAIVRYLIKERKPNSLVYMLSNIFTILPTDKKEEILKECLYLEEELHLYHPFVTLISQYNTILSTTLTKQIIDKLIEYMKNHEKKNSSELYFLYNLAFSIPTTMFKEISQILDPGIWPSWSKDLSTFLSTLEFRHDVLKEINL